MKTILLSALLLISIDSIYLYSTKHLFEKHISIIQGSPLKMNMYGAVACYIFLVLGLNYFILNSNKSVMDAFILGIVIYGVFETTNLVLFKKWPTYIAIMDTLWGGTLFALTTYIIKNIV
jgi:uncharacterized membrane protein